MKHATLLFRYDLMWLFQHFPPAFVIIVIDTWNADNLKTQDMESNYYLYFLQLDANLFSKFQSCCPFKVVDKQIMILDWHHLSIWLSKFRCCFLLLFMQVLMPGFVMTCCEGWIPNEFIIRPWYQLVATYKYYSSSFYQSRKSNITTIMIKLWQYMNFVFFQHFELIYAPSVLSETTFYY